MKSFIQLIKEYFLSFYSIDHYLKAIKFSFRHVLAYIMLFSLIYSLIVTAHLSSYVFKPMNQFLLSLPDKVAEFYPSQLEITIQNGQVQTNVDEPFSIPVTDLNVFLTDLDLDIANILPNTNLENLLVIDTYATPDDFEDYMTLSLLTSDRFVYLNEDGNIVIKSLQESEDFVVNHQLVVKICDQLRPYLPRIVPLLTLICFVVIALFFPFAIYCYLFPISLIVLLIGKIFSIPINIFKVYIINIYLYTSVTTVFGILSLAGLQIQLPFITSILIILFATVIGTNIKEQASSPAKPSIKPKKTASVSQP